MKIPAPLSKGHLCPECKGTGANIKSTLARKNDIFAGYVQCQNCLGNGLDPAEYFSWSKNDTNVGVVL